MSQELIVEQPDGELVIKTLAMPANTNANGDIFGGWILSQMDLGAGVIAKKYSPTGRSVTVGIEAMKFKSPVKIGDLVSCYAKILKLGNTSITITIETWVYDYKLHTFKMVTKGNYTYVAIDENGKAIPINKNVVE